MPRAFILRRLHSLLGLWLVFYLVEHLFVNSQAALFVHDGGRSFVGLVNQIQSIPYLPLVECLLLGVPFLIHGWWGILYALTSKPNAHPTDGTAPSLPQYKRNHAYSWQRITSWLLLVGIAAHVIHMRFLHYPTRAQVDGQVHYRVALSPDPGLGKVATALHTPLETMTPFSHNHLITAQAPDIGSAFFLVVRETFKNPIMVVLYSLLVIAACYHAFNGVWTFAISWGLTLSRLSQKRMRTWTTLLMSLVIFLGLLAAWGTYWTVQFQM